MIQIRKRLTYSNAMATLAVFIALGGGAYALSRNEVKSRHIAPDAVKGSDTQESSLRGIGSGLMAGQWEDLYDEGGISSAIGAPIGNSPGSPFGSESADDSAVAPVRFAATNLRVRLESELSAGTHTFIFRKPDVGDTALACTVSAGDQTCQSSARVVVEAGEEFSFRISSTATTDDISASFGWQALTP